MHVQFEFTKEDLVDASKRFLKRSKVIKSGIWKASVYSALTVAVMVFLVFQKGPTIGLVFGLVAAVIIVFLYPRWHERSLENRLRQLADEMMTSPGPYICEVEPRREGLWLRQMDKQIIYEWRSLEALEEAADSVDIFSRDGGGVIVRNRAFVSESDRAQFIELVRSSLAESRR